ncbi:peptide-methionine (S)-S-oxide reductase MsrA [Thalassotalea algicola]
MSKNLQTITLGGGCFWCIEAAYNQVKGIETAVSGYMGGTRETAAYRPVSQGLTDHAEVVQLTFDANDINIREILEIFFSLHDPTQLNRQGNDVGRQYRSAIFYHDADQLEQAISIIAEINADQIWPNPVVTEVTEALEFFSGEQYHQGYFNQNPENRYCQAIISPKLSKFKQTFAEKLK